MARLTWAGLAAALALAFPGLAAASTLPFTGTVYDLGSIGNPGSLSFDDGIASGNNDASHFDYIFRFTLTDTAKIDANVDANGTNFLEVHAVFYNADPSGQDLYTGGDPDISGGAANPNLIDIGAGASGMMSGGSSSGNGAGAGLASLGSGNYYLRIFGVPDGAIGHFTASLVTAAVAVTPIPAALPLFLAALGTLGFAARRRKSAMASAC